MIQIVKCNCCGYIVAACSEPYCYTDKEWLEKIKIYKQSYKVELIKNIPIKFNRCKNK